jgi:hypothetical protein
MSDVMTLERWLKYTDLGLTSVRSSKLKVVDKALAQYHKTKSEQDLDLLRTALMGWMMEKKDGRSKRDKHNAVTDLYNQVMNVPTKRKTGEEMYGLSLVQAEADRIVDKLFLHKRLEWREGFEKQLGAQKLDVKLGVPSAAANARTLMPNVSIPTPSMPGGGGGGGGAKAAALAQDLFNTLVPPGLRADVGLAMAKLVPTLMKDLAVAMTPFVGLIAAGGGAMASIALVLVDSYRIDQAKMHLARSMSTGTPEQAIESIIRIIQRELDNDTVGMAVGLTEFMGKLVGTLIDAGTASNAAVGLAANVATLSNVLYIIVRDVQEKNAANKLMMKRVPITVFQTCPIVGAYYVCCVPHSVLVNDVLTRFGQHGWKGDVERTVVRHIEPLREQGRRLIKAHRFIIRPLLTHPGVLGVNKKKLEEMANNVGKSKLEGVVGFGYDNLPPGLR